MEGVMRMLTVVRALAFLAALGAASPAAAQALGPPASERDLALFGPELDDPQVRFVFNLTQTFPDSWMRLWCNGPDVLLSVNFLRRTPVLSLIDESERLSFVIDGEDIPFQVFMARHDIWSGWQLVFFYDGSGPTDWLDRLSSAATIELHGVGQVVDLFGQFDSAQLRVLASECDAERFAAAAPLATEAGVGRAVHFVPTRWQRDVAWRPTATIPGTVTWRVDGTGDSAVLRASVDLSAAGLTAELTVGRWAGPPHSFRISLHIDPELQTLYSSFGSMPNGSNMLRDRRQRELLGEFYSGDPLDVTVDLVAIRRLFAADLMWFGQSDDGLLDPTNAFEIGEAGRAAYTAAMAEWGLAP
ncbi:MAG: hypothetical protein AB7U48_08455 [Bauldia sp.]